MFKFFKRIFAWFRIRKETRKVRKDYVAIVEASIKNLEYMKQEKINEDLPQVVNKIINISTHESYARNFDKNIAKSWGRNHRKRIRQGINFFSMSKR